LVLPNVSYRGKFLTAMGKQAKVDPIKSQRGVLHPFYKGLEANELIRPGTFNLIRASNCKARCHTSQCAFPVEYIGWWNALREF